jgi:4-hydroxybenzoate polyprenyltransferase
MESGSLFLKKSMLTLHGLVMIMRPRQWIKNSFVLAPLLFSGEFNKIASVMDAIFATLLFCVASSATYIVNDIKDIEQDKQHAAKRISRPLASGMLTIWPALFLLFALYGTILCSGFFYPQLIIVIIGYLLLNIAYTFVLKFYPVIDIFCIAIGFVLRIEAGAVAVSVPVSTWMFVTTLSLALFLATVKRRQELNNIGVESRTVLKKYTVKLIDRYAEMSATGAIVFYSLFVMSVRPELAITVPIVLFGLFRYWYIVDELDGGESPTDLLLKDWQLMSTVMLWILVCLFQLFNKT